jgi:hypothetical protein
MKVHKIKIDSKPVFISQRGDSFKVIKPWKNEDGSFNWFNMLTGGSWANLIIITIIVMISVGLIFEYTNNIGNLLDCFRIPGMLDKCVEIYGNVNQINTPINYCGYLE